MNRKATVAKTGPDSSLARATPGSPEITSRRIIVRRDAFDPRRIDVAVVPPIEGHPLDREFGSHREAYGYASGLRMTLRFPIVDEAGKAT